MSGKVLGIDLGTTNSVVAVANGKEARVLADSEGRRLIPSVVSFHPDGSILVGHEARERRLVDAKNTVYSTKRLIGRPYSSAEVQKAKERFAFDLEPTKVGGVQVRVRRGTFALPEISAMVLRHLRRVAEDSLGEPCSRAVITVPANFNELQRSATQAAGKVAGLEVLRILNEPTAATLAYGLTREAGEKVAVFDLGGGTFDLTLLDLDKDVFEVVSTAGDTFLGGDNLNLLVAEKMADACLRQHRFDAHQDSQAFERMRAAAEWAKCQLSSVKDVDVTLEELFHDGNGASVDFAFHMGRAELEQLIRPVISRAFDVVNDALRTVGRRPKEIDSVVLVGGSTRIPLVRSMVEEYFGRTPRADIDPDLIIAQGAAIHGFTIAGDKPAVEKGKAVGRVALKKPGKPAPFAPRKQQAFAPEEGRDDKQARFVDQDLPGPPRIVPSQTALGSRQPTQPGGAPVAPVSPLARAVAHLETPKKEVSSPRFAATLANDFNLGEEPTTVGHKPDLDALLHREAAERARQAAAASEPKPPLARGGTYPGATSAEPRPAPPAERPAAAPIEFTPVGRVALKPRDPSPRVEPVSTQVAVIRAVGVGVSPPPVELDEPDSLDAEPTKVGPAPKPRRDPTLMGSLAGAAGSAFFGNAQEAEPAAPVPVAPEAEARPRKRHPTLMGEGPAFSPGAAREPSAPRRAPEPPPEPPPPARPDPGLELSSSAFHFDSDHIDDPDLAETLREAEAALSRPVPRRAEPAQEAARSAEAGRSTRTREVGELPLPPPPAAPVTPLQAPAASPPAPSRQVAAQPAPTAPAPYADARLEGLGGGPPLALGAPPALRAPPPAPPPLAPRQPVVAMGGRPAPLLMDVTPLSLGVETAGGYCQQLVHRNAPIPTEKTRVFATARDGQNEVELKICQGESNRFAENQPLGVLLISPLRQARRGEVRIEITFMIDQNGILDVKATDLDARRQQAIRIALRGGVDASEIDAMRQRQESLFQ